MTKARVDTLITGSKIVTMDSERRIYLDGAIAIKGNKIAAVGRREDVEGNFEAAENIDGRQFVITPGFINGHIHITGDPLTRGYLPDDLDCDPMEKLNRWVIPRYHAHSPEDEYLSAQLSALEMMRSGITCFVEAGTVRHLDEVVDGLKTTGIRGRVGIWVEGRVFDPKEDQEAANAKAIRDMEEEVVKFPDREDALISAWPILVGHSMNTDEVWKAAKAIADKHKLGVSAHMSPYQSDPDWFLGEFGERPIEHLAALGVLGENVTLTHAAYVDENEVRILAETGTNIALCPLAALKGAFGISSIGRFPEMAAAGVNIVLGTDGYNTDMLRLVQITSALFKDARTDIKVFPAHEALTMATLNGAKAIGLQDEIGSLEPGKKADLVCHDTERPEWRPVFNIINQLVWSADGRGVHSVWIDGRRVIDDYHSTLIDEEAIYKQAQISGEAIIGRTDMPFISPWPVVQ